MLVYAGQPGGNGTDVAIRNTISANWNNKLDTVTTIGATGGGAGGWANEGSAFGLKSAIDAAGKAINAAANPAQQQLILFVTDHGGLRNVATDLNRSAPNIALVGGGSAPTPNTFITVPTQAFSPNPNLVTFTTLTKGFTTFGAGIVTNPNAPQNPGSLPSAAQLASPVFSILVPFSNNNAITPALMLHMGGTVNWELDLFNPVLNQSLFLPDSFQVVYNPSDPAGNKFVAADDLNKDAGIRIEFQLPGQPDGMDFQDFFFNANLDVSLANFTGTDYNIGEFAQENPALSPLSVPEPSSIVLCAGPLMIPLMLMWVRGRRRRGAQATHASDTAVVFPLMGATWRRAADQNLL